MSTRDASDSGTYPVPPESGLVAPASAHPTPIPAVPPPAKAGQLSALTQFGRQIVPYVSHQLQYVGRSGVTGVALIVFSIVCFVSANAVLHGKIAGLEADLASAQHLRADQLKSGLDLTPGARLKTLAAKLSGRGDLPAITEKIVAQAAAAGLTLERGSYEVDVVKSGKIARARLTFPVHGNYPDIRRFVDGTLDAVPGAAVDGLRIERKEIGATEVDADIQFAVYLRNSP